MPPSLEKSAGRAAFWQILGGVWQTLVRLGASIFLARALEPRDFGLFGMAVISQEFIAYLGALGMGIGIIAKEEATEEDIATCFWIMAAMRFSMFLLAFFGAPIAAEIFSEPRLTSILRVTSLAFIISIIQIIPETLLFKEMRFGVLNIIRGISVLLESTIAVILAVRFQLGYRALVYTMLIGSFFQSAAFFFVAGWKPKWKFSKKSFHYLFNFGIHGLGFSITNYLSQNLDYLLVGRILGATSLGLYEFAYRIPHLVLDRIARPVGDVVFPALSKVQSSNEKMVEGYIKTVKFVTLIAFPLLGGLAAMSETAVPILWGAKWQPIVIPLQILCLAAALRCIPQPIGAIFYCKRRPDLPFKFAVFTLAWTAFVVGILGYRYGVIGVATGMLISTLAPFFAVRLASKMIGMPVKIIFYALWPAAISTTLCGLSAIMAKKIILLTEVNNGIALTVGIITGAVVYSLSLVILFKSLTREIISTIDTVCGSNLACFLKFRPIKD